MSDQNNIHEDSIVRDEHDAEHPYFVLSRDFIRDQSLSINLRWLLSYCLSFDRKFLFRIPWIMKTQGISKNKMYSILNEGIRKGYVNRQSYLEGGLRKWKYTFSEFPKFKKCLPCPQKQDLVFRDLENEDTKNYQSSSYEEEKKEQYKECSDPVATSADASELIDFFLSKIKEKKKDFLLKNRSRWLKDFDLITRKDKRSVERIKEIISWLVDDSNQLSWYMSPSKIRDCFDVLEVKMGEAHDKKLRTQNIQYTVFIKEKYPNEVKGLRWDTNFVSNPSICKEVPFNLPHETFKRAFLSLFGGEVTDG